MAHSGVKATQAQILQHYVWPGVKKDVSNWTRACQECQKNKVSRYTKSLSNQIDVPDERFEHVHIDIVGPLPISNGRRYILTMIDRFSRWPEAVAIPDMTAETVAKTFVEVWVARFGTPSKLTSDQGRQFESQLMKELAILLGLERIHTTPYHPQANGMIECWHRPLKTALESYKSSWTDALPLVLLGLRTAIRGETSASDMLYGTTIRIPGAMMEKQPLRGSTESFVTNLREKMNSVVPRPASNNDTKRHVFVPKDLGTCTHVFLKTDKVRAALEPPFTGPYEVLTRTSKTLTIKIMPLVLLGLRTAIHGETSASDMLYGTAIRIPGAMMEKQPLRGSTESFVTNLREKMSSVVPRPASNNDTKRHVFVPKDLGTCTHVFLKTDKVRAALEPPFTGPYEVLTRTSKTLTIKIKNKEVTVSIDRLKPAYFAKDPDPSSDRITKSGHHVRFRIQ
ncbi:hypothetical protein RP20_CCG006763 [Aedes albopictus]|nr:hypothetical protein RP20_CCG006763 [Aedes albopictus]